MTSGGRVLGVTAFAEDLQAAIRRVYAAVEKIHFEGIHYRQDIGAGALRRLPHRRRRNRPGGEANQLRPGKTVM